jgi:HYDIN/CFA65/VesB family protein/centrosomal CEP192-like protein
LYCASQHSTSLSIFRHFALASWLLALTFFLSGCVSGTSHSTDALPVLSLSAASFDFKTVVLGQTQTKSLRITNTGSAPLRISGLSLSSKQFVINGPSVPRVILPNLYLDYTVSFTPTDAGNASASLAIQSDTSSRPSSVSLSGVGERVISSLQVSPSALNFGSLTLQTTSTQNVSLLNTGDVNVTISGVMVVGAGFGYSDLSPGYSLPPNQQVSFQVWFKPQVRGAASGTLSILSANLSSPVSLSVTGDGVSSTPPTPPSTPAASQHSVHLTWDASTSSVVGYRVYRATSSSGPFGIISSTTVTSTAYDDSTVSSGATYYYQVTAFDSSGEESPASNVATAAIPTP